MSAAARVHPAKLRTGTASAQAIAAHLRTCDAGFMPPLSERVDIDRYAAKLAERALCIEAWDGDTLAGLVAAYANEAPCDALPASSPPAPAFISNVSVLPERRGDGTARRLMQACISSLAQRGCTTIALEVDARNAAAQGLYRRCGFVASGGTHVTTRMQLDLDKDSAMSTPRDYNTEIQDTVDHRYAYGFDLDVMHPFMIRSFQPFFRPGSVLELGCFKGDFTRRLAAHFDDITCVEASGEALAEARRRIGEGVNFVHATFESASLPRRYDNIVITHVLEHLDDPVRVLRRINDEWLSEGGRLFLVCPNANAPSRQIAVKMGLISHNAAVTLAESAHGHRCTYSLDTLERDAVAGGLRVLHRSGIFFKALANFQWDRLLKTDIIDAAYLEGCFQFGQQYPDLCSSILLICEAGPPAR